MRTTGQLFPFASRLASRSPRWVIFSVLLVSLLFPGCAAYNAQVEPGRTLAGVRKYFVVANNNDSRGLEHRLVAALRARGLTADSGPQTMMPEDTQAIVTYDDHWAWDFGDHLVALQVSVRDPKSPQPFASAAFTSKIPGRQQPAAIVADLVDKLLAGTAR